MIVKMERVYVSLRDYTHDDFKIIECWDCNDPDRPLKRYKSGALTKMIRGDKADAEIILALMRD